MTIGAVKMDNDSLSTFLETFDNISVTKFGTENYRQAKIREEVGIDLTNLDGECSEQPTRFMWWAQVSNRANMLLEKERANTKRMYAKLAKLARSEEGIVKDTPEAKGHRITKEMVTEYVENHVLYLEAKEKEISAEYLADTYKSMVEALRQRNSMLKVIRGRTSI